MDVSISSTSIYISPSSIFQVHVSGGSMFRSIGIHSFKFYSATLRSALVTLYFLLFLYSSQVLLLRHRLDLQFSGSFTINSSFETMGEVLHIISNLLFPICRWNVHVLNWRVPDIFLSGITPFPFQPSCIHVKFSRSFTLNSTFETMGEVLHIVFNFALPFFSWNVHVSFCWT